MRAYLKKGLSNIVGSLSHKYWLEDTINNFICKPKEFYKPSGFYASSAGACPRLIQLKRSGISLPQPDGNGQRIFDNGNDVHLRYGRYLKGSGCLIADEAKFTINFDGFDVVGRADFILNSPTNEQIVAELKSINSRRFKELIDSGKPKIENFLQLNICLKGLNINTGLVMYECKDNQQVKFFPVFFDQAKYDETIDVFKMIHEYEKKEQLVPKPDKCPDPRYCPAAQTICKEG
jgi:CRISPR/Cas system-associated exonuclease Cas4 (RecB family)